MIINSYGEPRMPAISTAVMMLLGILDLSLVHYFCHHTMIPQRGAYIYLFFTELVRLQFIYFYTFLLMASPPPQYRQDIQPC